MTKRKKKALMHEVDMLWASGYGDALRFWGDRQIRLYNQGIAIGAIAYLGWEIMRAAFKAHIENKQ